MPERSLILFPKYVTAEKKRRFGGSDKIHFPKYDKQIERMTPKLRNLQSLIDNNKLNLQNKPDFIEPEYTIVLETAGDPQGLYCAVANLSAETNQGIEWLYELVEYGIENDENFYAMDKNGLIKPEKGFNAKLFCVMTNIQALSELLSLWKQYSQDKNMKFPLGKTGLKNVFNQLRDMHLWGFKERIVETGILEIWKEEMDDPTVCEVKCEIELFFRKSEQKRSEAEIIVRKTISDFGGKVICSSCVEGISYHALLVAIPRDSVEKIIENCESVDLVKAEQIMFFRPSGQMVTSGTYQSREFENDKKAEESILQEPIVALFDGLPQENHPLLNGYLTIDDPDDFASSYLLNDRLHGTSMASQIIHGDLSSVGYSTSRKIYVRPIMKSFPFLDTRCEGIPDDMLIVDKVHEAVRRLFEPQAGSVANSIKIINFSIGIRDLHFYNMMSPLARLLDWLSFKYRVLFIVSAGNHPESIDLDMSFRNFSDLSIEERDVQFLKLLDKNTRHLKLLSPAESINALTIGALFSDESTFVENERNILPCSDIMPSPISSLGRGLNRSIKPDLIFNGGRNLINRHMIKDNIANWRLTPSNSPPGILSACPIEVSSGSNKVMYSFGTSNSTALMTHESVKCYDILTAIFNEEMNLEVPGAYAALLIKAMLVHGTSWGNISNTITSSLNLAGRGADDLHKFLGYGTPDISRVEECARNRVTLIGYGDLQPENAHLYELPVPFDFHTKKIYRCLTVTLSYFTPIVPSRQNYRANHVWFTVEDNGKKLVSERIDASDKAVARGTIQHERFNSDKAIVWGEDDKLYIRVNCRCDASENTEIIPYAIFVTFEVAEGVDIDVYQSVLTKIKEKIPAR